MKTSLQTRLLRAVATKHQVAVAEHSGMEKTAVHRVVNGERGIMLEELEAFLSALDMAVIECSSGETVTLPTVEHQALRTLARKALCMEGEA